MLKRTDNIGFDDDVGENIWRNNYKKTCADDDQI